MVECQHVSDDEVQAKLAELRQKGWTLVNIARAIGQATRTVESWNQGTRSPANLQSVLISLDKLAKRKRIPKKKIYVRGKT
jgi:DNA-binding transcriptional regulator YiaG